MVAIVSSSGLGVFDSSLSQLNGAGPLGDGKLGQANGNAHVNIATGNLVLQFNDQTLEAVGKDLQHLRTYNSQGNTTDGDNDRWRWLGEKRIKLVGELNTTGSYLNRTTGDGHVAVYRWDAAKKAYISSSGTGADDRIVRSGKLWAWTEGSTKVAEYYDVDTGWIKNSYDKYNRGFQYTFNNDGQLTRVEDNKSGQAFIYVYNSDGKLAEVSTYDATSKKSTKQVKYDYDQHGRLTTVTSDLTLDNSITGAKYIYVTSYTYDDSNGISTRVASISQNDGTTANYTYVKHEGVYKIKTVTDQQGVTTFNYGNKITYVINGEGEERAFRYDDKKRLTQILFKQSDKFESSFFYTYDANDNVIKVFDDGRGGTHTYAYDDQSNLTREVDAHGNVTEWHYDNNNLLRTKTLFVGGQELTEHYVYGGARQLRYIISAEGRVTENRYYSDNMGLLTHVLKFSNHRYDTSTLSKTSVVTEAHMNEWRNGFNRSKTQVIQYDYNHLGQRVKETQFAKVNQHAIGELTDAAVVTEYTYDIYGQLLQTISLSGSDRSRKSVLESRTYDGHGRLTKRVSQGVTTTNQYESGKLSVTNSQTGVSSVSLFDGRGRLVSVSETQPSPSTTRKSRYFYDDAGRLAMTEDFTGARSFTLYDNVGRVALRVDAEGGATKYTYLKSGDLNVERQFAKKVNTSSWFNGASVVIDKYEPTTSADDRITTHWYNKNGLLTKTIYEHGDEDRIVNNTYDAASRRIAQFEASRKIEYRYDKDGRLIATIDQIGYLTENTYDGVGRLILTTRYPSKVTDRSADLVTMRKQARVDNASTSGYAEKPLFIRYFYDASGRKVGEVDEQGYLTETVYDPANRNTREVRYNHPIPELEFEVLAGVSWDATGNTLKKVSGGSEAWNAGAESRNILPAGENGWVQFTAGDINGTSMLGLNNAEEGVHDGHPETDYVLHLKADGVFQVRENNVNRGAFGKYAKGDVFRIERAWDTITYKQNGKVVYTSTVKSNKALRIDSTFATEGTQLHNIEGSFFGVNADSQLALLKNLVTHAKPESYGAADVAGDHHIRFRGTVGVAIDPVGGRVVKTSDSGWDNAGIESHAKLTAGEDGWVEFMASETDTHRAFGLSNVANKQSAHYKTIDYGFYLRNNGEVDIYEAKSGGARFAKAGKYYAGDILRVERIGDKIVYKRNDKVIYHSKVKSTETLRLDGALHTKNSTFENIKGSFLHRSSHDDESILSYRLNHGVRLDSATHSLVKTTNTDWGNAGIDSSNILEAGKNGWVEATLEETHTHRTLGFSVVSRAANSSLTEIDYGMYVRGDGTLSVVERTGGNRWITISDSYQKGDVIRVERIDNKIYYKQNGEVIHTSKLTSNEDLRLDAALYQKGSTLKNIKGSFFTQHGQKAISRLSILNTQNLSFDHASSTITKTAGSAWDNVHIDSRNTLAENENGWVQFTAEETDAHRAFGFASSAKSEGRSLSDLDYGFYLRSDGGVGLYERTGGNRWGTIVEQYQKGDVFRVERHNGKILYKHNGITVHTSKLTSTESLRLSANIHKKGGTLKNLEGSFFLPIAHTTKTTFDAYGRVTHVTQQDGTITNNIYDKAGRLHTVIEALGSNQQNAIRRTFNGFGQVTGELIGLGHLASDLPKGISDYGTQYKYDLMGRKIAEIGQEGYAQYFFYDDRGQLIYTVNALGEVTKNTYNAFGEVVEQRRLTKRIGTNFTRGGHESKISSLVTKVQNSAAGSTGDAVLKTRYNQLGLVSSRVDAEARTTTYDYDRYGDLRNIYTPYGPVSTFKNVVREHFVYDAIGRVTQRHKDHDNLSARTITRYDAFGRVYAKTDHLNRWQNTDYFNNGRTIVQRDHSSRYTTTSTDFLGRKLSVVDSLGGITAYRYGDSDRSVTMTTPEGISSTTWKTRRGQVERTFDGNGNETTFKYSRFDTVNLTTNALGRRTSQLYNKRGLLAQVTDARGKVTEFKYDTANRLSKKVVDANGEKITTFYEYDGQGRKVAVTEAHGTAEARKTEYLYDRNGVLVQEIVDAASGGLNLSTRYTYDAAGNQTKIERGTRSSPSQQVVSYTYDRLNRKTSETLDPTGLKLTTRYSYDLNNNLTRVTHPNGAKTWYVYNTANQLSQEINHLGHVTTFSYDVNGNQIRKRRYVNTVSTSGFTEKASWVKVAGSSKDRVILTVFDKDNRETFTLTSVENNRWVVTENRFDDNGNIIESRRYDKKMVQSKVDALASNSSQSGWYIRPEEVIELLQGEGYADTAWGQSTTSLGKTRITRFAYDALNQLRFTINAEGHLTQNFYDAVGNLSSQTYFALKPKNLKGDYSEANIFKNRVGNVADRETRFRYDGANRLQFEFSDVVTVRNASNHSVTGRIRKEYVYDALGQVTQLKEGAIEKTDGKYDTTSERTTSYQYDGAGRQIKTILPGWYSAKAQQVSKSKGQDAFQRTIDVTYDVLGNAVRNKIRTGTSVYVYQYKAYDKIGREIYDVDGEGAVTKKTYDKLGNVTKVTRGADKVSFGRSIFGSGNTYTSTALTALNNAVKGSTSRTVSTTYDILGRKTKVVLPGDSSTNHYAYGSSVTQNADQHKYTTAPETRYTYNTFGEVIKEAVRVDNNRTAYSHYIYDHLGRKVAELDPLKYGTKRVFDALGNLITETEFYKPYTGTIDYSATPNFSYDSEFRDRTKRFTHDNMGRVTSVKQDNVYYLSLQSNNTYGNIVRSAVVTSETAYNAFGEVSYTKDALNNYQGFEYDTRGNVVRQKSATQNIAGTGLNPFSSPVKNVRAHTDYTYDVFGKVAAESRYYLSGTTKKSLVSRSNRYDHAGNQYLVKDWEGNNQYFGFDVNGRIIREAQSIKTAQSSSNYEFAHTIEKHFHYDKVGRRIASLIQIYGQQTQAGDLNVYNNFGEVVTHYKVKGSSNSFKFDRAIVNSYYYDKAGRVRLQRSAEGDTYFYYDLVGRVTRQSREGLKGAPATRELTENHYDLNGNLRVQRLPYHQSGANNERWDPMLRRDYDRWGNVTRTIDEFARQTHYTYNHNNQVRSERLAGTAVKKTDDTNYSSYQKRNYYYDKLGRQVKEYQSAHDIKKEQETGKNAVTKGRARYQIYDRAGNIIKKVDFTNKKVDFVYDIHGNKVGERDGTGIVYKYRYNKNGLLTKKSVLELASYSSTIAHVSDGKDREITVNEYKYDQAGRVIAKRDGYSNFDKYKLDDRGNIVEKTERSGGVTKYTYDFFDNVLSEKTNMSLYSHTVNKRVFLYYGTTTYSNEVKAIYGNVSTPIYENVLVGSDTKYKFADYQFGLKDTHTYVRSANSVKSISKQTIKYSYDKMGRLYRETNNANAKQYTQYEYWQNGLLKRKTDRDTAGNASYISFNYDIRSLKTRERVYKRTATGNITSNLITNFKYDSLRRIIQINAPQGTFNTELGSQQTATLNHIHYWYDEWGNRRSIHGNYTQKGKTAHIHKRLYFEYDAEGRVLTEGTVMHGRILAGPNNNGVVYTYDGAGKLKSKETFYKDNVGAKRFEYKRDVNIYNTLNQVSSVSQKIYYKDRGGNIGTGTVKYIGASASKTIETHKYDTRGFRVKSVVNGQTTSNSYRHDGQLNKQTVTEVKSGKTLKVSETDYVYSKNGELKEYTYKHFEDGKYRFYNTYQYLYTGTYAGRKIREIKVQTDEKNRDTGKTINTYDHLGQLVKSQITEKHVSKSQTGSSYKYFSYDANGQIVGMQYKRYGKSAPDVQTYYYINGSQAGDAGDLGFNITPIESQYKNTSPSSYTIRRGDNLTSIAQAIYGDGSLWYVIAEANAFTLGPTDSFADSDIGRGIKIPTTTQAVKNNSTTFKPYNPTEVIGDLTPIPSIVPPPKESCNWVAAIIIVVVAVVVTVFTAGAAAAAIAPMLGGASGGIIAGGAAALAGGGLAGGLTTAVIAGAIGGFVGSVVSQGVGVALGEQDKIDWRAARGAALSSAVSFGIGSYASGAQAGTTASNSSSSFLSSAGKHAVTGARSYAISYATNKAVGLETSFSWRGLAASVAGSVAGNSLANGLDASGAFDFTGGGFFSDVARGAITGAATAKFYDQWAGAETPDYGQIALDAFANQVASRASSSLGNVLLNSTAPATHNMRNGTKGSVAGSSSESSSAVGAKSASGASVANALGEVDDAIETGRAAPAVSNVDAESNNGRPLEEVVVTGYRDGRQSAEFFLGGVRQTNLIRNGFDRDGDAVYVDKGHLARQTAIARQEWNANEANFRHQRAQAANAVVVNEPSFYDSALDTVSDLRTFAQEAGDTITNGAVSVRDSLVGAWDVVSTEVPLIWDSLVDTIQAYDAGKPKSFELAAAAGGEWKWGFVGYEYGVALNADGSGEYGGAWMVGSGVQEMFNVGLDIYNLDLDESISRREFLRRVKDYVVPTGGFAEVSMLGSGTSDANIFMNGHSVSADLTASFPLRGKKGSLYLSSNHGVSFDPSGRIDGINFHKFQGFTLGVSSDKANIFNPEFTYEYSSADGNFGASTAGRVSYELGANFVRGTATVANMFANLPGVAYSAWNDQPIEIKRFYNFRN